MALNTFDVETGRRLSLALISAAGAFLFAAFQLVGTGIEAGDRAYAAGFNESIRALLVCLAIGFLGFVCSELAGHPAVPEQGHPHSKRNYRETAFALICGAGLLFLVGGVIAFVNAAMISAP
jgi:hypothetical protein